MPFLLDFLPIIAFFIAYKQAGLYVATAVCLGLSLVQLLIKRVKQGRFEPLSLLSFTLLLLFGSATLLLQNPWFIKWKPTVVYSLMGLILLISPLFRSETWIETALKSVLDLPKAAFAILNRLWGGFFILLGILNVVVAYRYSTDTWVQFKLFGLLGLTLAFLVLQALLLPFLTKLSNKV